VLTLLGHSAEKIATIGDTPNDILMFGKTA